MRGQIGRTPCRVADMILVRSTIRLARKLAIALALAAIECNADSADRPQSGDCAALIPGQIEELAHAKHIPGLSIAVGTAKTAPWIHGYGLGNLEGDVAVSPEHSLFRIGSTSKSLTAFGLIDRKSVV